MHGLAAPAVGLAAFGHREDRQRAFAAGYRVHVCKPADLVERVA
jgi:hypothetical protein